MFKEPFGATFKRLIADDRGEVAIEYSLIAALIFLSIVPTVVWIGFEVVDMYQEIQVAMQNLPRLDD